jgi:hypothetical protein
MKTVKYAALIAVLLFITTMVGLIHGYQRGYSHGEKITNKWWIDQQSKYYDATEVIKKRRAKHLDII